MRIKMERKDTKDLMFVILALWFVVTTVIFLGWIITSEEVYDPEERGDVTVHNENWSNTLRIGVVGIFGLGFLAFVCPSPKDGG